MLKRIINVLLVSAVLAVGLTASVALANTAGPPDPVHKLDDKGVPNANEDKETGQPTSLDGENIANGFGAVTSQRASEFHDIGEHSSNPLNTRCPKDAAGNLIDPDCVSDAEAIANGDPQLINRDTPRDGVGNVSRNDGFLSGVIDTFNGDAPAPKDQGPSPGAHGCFIGQFDELIGQDDPIDPVTSCTNDPGLPGHPGGQPE